MRHQVREAGARAGRGALSLGTAVVLLVSVLAATRSRVPGALAAVAAAAAAATAYLGGGRWIERRPITEFRGRRGWGEFAGGVGLGLLLFGAVMGLLWAAGVYRPSGRGTASLLAAGAIAAVAEATVEEILFRGFLFRLLADVAGSWWALLVTAALFGAAHAFNNGATAVSTAAIALEAGILLGAAYALTGRLWLPIGLHAAWNWAEAFLFGMTMSGVAAAPGFVAGRLQGPGVLTGGAFGPEASAPAVLVCLAASALLLWRARRSGRLLSPAWNRASERETPRNLA